MTPKLATSINILANTLAQSTNDNDLVKPSHHSPLIADNIIKQDLEYTVKVDSLRQIVMFFKKIAQIIDSNHHRDIHSARFRKPPPPLTDGDMLFT